MRLFGVNKKKSINQSDHNKTTNPTKRLLSYQFANMQGIGRRNRQEDAFSQMNVMDVKKIRKEGILFVICDGMGGMADGKMASETAVRSIRASFLEIDREKDIAEQLTDAVFEAGSAVYRELGGTGGTTIVACIIYNEKFYFTSVGDSYLYLYRNGQLVRLNEMHNVCTSRYKKELADGGFDPFKGRNDKEAEALTQFLGMEGLAEADYFRKPLAIHSGDIFFACSDGIGGVLAPDILKSCLSMPTPAEMCSRIEQEICVVNQPNQDNYTGVILKCLY